MKSAYLTLGLPGDATADEIRRALEAAQLRFSKTHLVEHPEDIERLRAIQDAAKILLDPAMRAAHDRKLLAGNQTQVQPLRRAAEAPQTAWFQKPLWIGALVVVMVFAGGAYLQKKNRERQLELAQIALERSKLEEQQAQQQRAEEAQQAALVAKLNAEAKANDARLRAEGLAAARSANQYNAQRNMAIDQQRIRNLCMQNYGRPNC
jgi:DnaJ-class molecular chaperone